MKFLLFSSVGNSYDKAILSWFGSEKNFDIFFCYYEDNEERKKLLDSLSDICIYQKGSKFQNFQKCYNKYNFDKYEYIWIVDDDIVLETEKVNELFKLAKEYNSPISQPSMHKNGRNMQPITIHQPGNIFRYNNFIEVGVMLFRKDIIKDLLTKIGKLLNEKKLFCYGIDILCTKYYYDEKNKFIIFDKIITRNPRQKEKRGNKRECFKNFNQREIVKFADKLLKM